MITKIYILSEPDGKIRYVGKTIRSLHKRLCVHLFDARKGEDTHKGRWIRSIIQCGYLPLITLIGEVAGDGNKEEIAWISYFRAEGVDLVNTTDGGDGGTGHIVTDEVRKRMSKAHAGKSMLTLRGVPRTKEICEKIRQSHLGKKLSPEHIKAITGIRHKMPIGIGKIASERGRKRYSNPAEIEKLRERMLLYWKDNEGREVSEATRKKMSLSHIGKKGFWVGKKRPSPSETTRRQMRDSRLKYLASKKVV